MSRPSVLRELLSLYEKHDGFKQQLEMYSRQVDAKEFAFFRDMLLTMKGVMMSDVFSHSFSELGAADKDVMQRTYYQLNQWLDFMLGPMKVINAKKSRLVQMNPTRGKATPNPQGKEKSA